MYFKKEINNREDYKVCNRKDKLEKKKRNENR